MNTFPASLTDAILSDDKESIQKLLAKWRVDTENWCGKTLLHFACRHGKIEALKVLIQMGATIEKKDNNGWTPLLKAACYGHTDIVTLLVSEFKADINTRGKYGTTLVHIACQKGSIELLETLVGSQKFNADLFCAPTMYIETPIHLACKYSPCMVKSLLEHAPTIKVDVKDKYGTTPLHIACGQDTCDMLLELLQHDHSAKVDVQDNNGSTPLHVACKKGDLNLINALLDYHAKVDVQDHSGKTPLHIACSKTDLSVLKVLLCHDPKTYIDIQDRSGATPLLTACRECEYSRAKVERIVKVLVMDYNCDPKISDNHGCTPLDVACTSDNLCIVQTLLQHGGYLSCSEDFLRALVNNHGETLLEAACASGNFSMVQTLIKHGASMTTTCIIYAIEKNCPDILEILLREGNCDLNAKNDKGLTPLHVACTERNDGMVETLLEHGAEVNVENNWGLTPLHVACTKGNYEIVQTLLKHGAKAAMENMVMAIEGNYCDIVEALFEDGSFDLNLESNIGLTPLRVACTNGNHGIVQTLLKHGAKAAMKDIETAIEGNYCDIVEALLEDYCFDLNLESNIGLTPLRVACTNGNHGIVQTLLKHGAKAAMKDIETAIEGNYCDIVEALLEDYCFDLNLESNIGLTPLRVACTTGNHGIVQTLLKHGAKVAMKDIETAIEGNHCDIVEALLEDYCFDLNLESSNGSTPLRVACTTGNHGIVQTLLKHSAKAAMKDIETAIEGNHCDIVEALLEDNSFDLNLESSNGLTPLCVACTNGNHGIVQTLLKHGAKPAMKDIETAIRGNYCDIVEALLENSNLNLNVVGSGFTPLHIACIGRKREIVQTLLKHGAIAAMKDIETAIKGNHCDIVEALLEVGNFDLNVESSDGLRPLHIACAIRSSRMIRILKKHGARATSFLTRIMKDNYCDVVKILLEDGNFDLNMESSDGLMPLEVACSECSPKMIQMLIKHGAKATTVHVLTAIENNSFDVLEVLLENRKFNLTDKFSNGLTPLQLACNKGNSRIVQTLIKHGARVKARDLVTAIENNHSDVVKALLDGSDCDLNETSSEGLTPLHAACNKGNFRVIQALINHGANVIGSNFDMPLITAVKLDLCDLLSLLVTNRSMINILDSQGCSLLHIAAINGSQKVLKMLIKDYGMAVSLVDKEGNTPLHLASREGQDRCMEMLLYEFKSSVHTRNRDAKTPKDLATKPHMKEVLSDYQQFRNKDLEADYSTMEKLAVQRYSGSHCITRLFVVGHPGAGKSSLVETLKREGFFQSFGKVSEQSVPPHTAGIVPSVYTSATYGRVQFYDFAGDPEYYSSHAAILEKLFQSEIGVNLFFVVLNLEERDDEIEAKFIFWYSFIHHNSKNLQQLPIILAIGGHADLLPSKEVKRKKELIVALCEKYKAAKYFHLDCRNPGSKKVKKLRQTLNGISKNYAPYVLSYEGAVLLGLLEKDFSQVPACTAQTLVSHIQDVNLLRLPRSLSCIYPLLLQLQAIGTLLILGGQEEDCYLVLNVAQLTNEVHKKLFSEDTNLISESFNIGLLPPAILNDILPQYITKDCLVQLQYCQEIPHVEVIRDQDKESSILATSFDKSVLFFPALCKLGKGKDISWHYGDVDHIGWLARCTDPHDHFSVRFLHVLLLRIVFRFTVAMPSALQETSTDHSHFQRRCTMWKTGVHWLMEEGVECEVDVDISKEVVVKVRCQENNSKSCFTLFNSIISCVMETKAEFCHSAQLQFFLQDVKENLYLMEDVERCLLESKTAVLSCTENASLPCMRLQHIGNTFWNTLFFIDVESVCSYLKSIVTEWFPLGTSLGFPHSTLREIEVDHHTSIARQKEELITRWLGPVLSQGPNPSTVSSSSPCWWSLVRALQDVDDYATAEAIKADHMESIGIQKKLLDSKCRSVKPDEEFLQSLSQVVSSKWPYLAALLSLTSSDIQAVRVDGKGKSQEDQALLMLGKWSNREGATYGQLFEKIRPISIFQLCH